MSLGTSLVMEVVLDPLRVKTVNSVWVVRRVNFTFYTSIYRQCLTLDGILEDRSLTLIMSIVPQDSLVRVCAIRLNPIRI